jgi:hypothetical protein
MDNIVLKIVASVYNITVSDILSKSKKGKEPEASRMVTLFLAQPSASPNDIAYSINRDRAMYYNNLEKIAVELKVYKDVQLKFNSVKMKLTTYLENTKTDLENWLINNPHQDQPKREEKLERLADVKETYEYINNLNIE